MRVHAYQMGPVKDRNRARTGRHGSLRVEGRTLLFVGNDGKQVSLTLDRGDDMLALAKELARAAVEISIQGDYIVSDESDADLYEKLKDARGA